MSNLPDYPTYSSTGTYNQLRYYESNYAPFSFLFDWYTGILDIFNSRLLNQDHIPLCKQAVWEYDLNYYKDPNADNKDHPYNKHFRLSPDMTGVFQDTGSLSNDGIINEYDETKTFSYVDSRFGTRLISSGIDSSDMIINFTNLTINPDNKSNEGIDFTNQLIDTVKNRSFRLEKIPYSNGLWVSRNNSISNINLPPSYTPTGVWGTEGVLDHFNLGVFIGAGGGLSENQIRGNYPGQIAVYVEWVGNRGSGEIWNGASFTSPANGVSFCSLLFNTVNNNLINNTSGSPESIVNEVNPVLPLDIDFDISFKYHAFSYGLIHSGGIPDELSSFIGYNWLVPPPNGGLVDIFYGSTGDLVYNGNTLCRLRSQLN